MAKPASKKEEITKLPPIKPAHFGLETHKVRKFCALVQPNYKDHLEDPAIWANIAGQMRCGDEVRMFADDATFVAYGIVTFAQGSSARIKVLDLYELDSVEDVQDSDDQFEIKLCGPKKWCIRNKETGDIHQEGIATQLEAMKELNDLRKALSR